MTTSEGTEFKHFFEVNLDLFEGPIDLLLHLVKREELPIERLSLAQVTEQYLHCIERLQNYDFDVAGEYLVIAATLLSIKSSMLVNEPAEIPENEEEKEGDLNPEEELLRRLREAEIFRQRAIALAARELLGVDVFPSAPASTSVVSEFRYKDHDPMLLGKAFKKLLDKSGEASSFVIDIDPISIADRMMTILDQLKETQRPLRFDEVVTDLSIPSIIATFCAVLELCKRFVVTVRQESIFGEIVVMLLDGSEVEQDLEGFASDFDGVASAG